MEIGVSNFFGTMRLKPLLGYLHGTRVLDTLWNWVKLSIIENPYPSHPPHFESLFNLGDK